MYAKISPGRSTGNKVIFYFGLINIFHIPSIYYQSVISTTFDLFLYY